MPRWFVSVSMSLDIDYDDIVADTEDEAKRIAEDRAMEDIEFNNATSSHVRADLAWSDEEDSEFFEKYCDEEE